MSHLHQAMPAPAGSRVNSGRKRGRETGGSELFDWRLEARACGTKRQRRGGHVSRTNFSERNINVDVTGNNYNICNTSNMMDVDTDNDSWNTQSNSGSDTSHLNCSDMVVTDSVDSTYSDGYSLLPLAKVDSQNITTVSTWLAPR